MKNAALITARTAIPIGSLVIFTGLIMWISAVYAKVNQTATDFYEYRKDSQVDSKESRIILEKLSKDITEIKTDLKYLGKGRHE